eukprot:g13893.t1
MVFPRLSSCGLRVLPARHVFSSPLGSLIATTSVVRSISGNRRSAFRLPMPTYNRQFGSSTVTSSASEETDWEKKSKLGVVLFQYEVCPFSNKVRAFLDYHKIPYKKIEVNPLTKAESSHTGFKSIPVVMVEGKFFNESSNVMKMLHTKQLGLPEPSAEDLKWLQWVDDRFVRLTAPNIYRNIGESLESFAYLTHCSNFPAFTKFYVKYAGAAMMYLIAGKLKKKYKLQDERQELYSDVDKWLKEAVGDKPFAAGNQPGLSDIAVFGVLRSLQGFRTGRDVMSQTQVNAWYQRMSDAVGQPLLLP